MLANLLLAAAFQILPFYEQRDSDYVAVRPFFAEENEVQDALWPIWTSHRDWWRCCMLLHYQENRRGGYQFEVDPLWFNGRASETGDFYWGLFPIYGYHPHFLLLYDFNFCLWPLYHSYRTYPRNLESTSVLFPIFHWRSDASWGVWPLAGVSHNRSDDAAYCLWPIFNWQHCYPDRDTAGEGSSFMFWPLFARVNREREHAWQFIPPLFGYSEVPDGWVGRFPWPIVEIERRSDRHRTSVFPLVERIVNYRYFDGQETTSIWRFGWRIVELLPDETRVFPIWVSRPDGRYFRFWPFWESSTTGRDEQAVRHSRFLSLFPIRHVPSVDRNWAKFWTFYERDEKANGETEHSLLWGIIRWTTGKGAE